MFTSQDFPALGSRQAGAQQSSDKHSSDGAGGDVGAFGMQGLLGMTKSLATVDLTQLGLNLNSRHPLHTTFGLPWSDRPTVPEPDARMPDCYKLVAPPLRTGHFTKFEVATLMYIFYCLPRDTLQLYAAHELYRRGWHYHTEARLWFTPTADPSSGQYHYFNLPAWEKQVFTADTAGGLARGFLPVADLGPLPGSTEEAPPAAAAGQ